MPILTNKNTEQAVRAAIAAIKVRKSLAGRYSSMSNFKEWHG